MVAYRRIDEVNVPPGRKHALSHELFHGLTPEEFDSEAKSVADAQAMTPAVRRRMEAQLTERLMTPPDAPSWGPDWVKHGERDAPKRGAEKKGLFSRVFNREDDDEDESIEAADPEVATDEDYVIARNMEKSRQIAHYSWLYAGAIVVTLGIAFLAMFVDYHIIREVWVRALSNEFMQVPDSLKSSVIFKSLQVIFAVLIVHFMLKITGVYGRNILVTTAFLLALVMIGSLGYLVAYNNMSGGTSTTLEHQQTTTDSGSSNNSIDQLFSTSAKQDQQAQVQPATDTSSKEFSLPLPKLSQNSLADTDSWVWLAFASVIFFIVTVVAALYMQGAENNIRNVSLAGDYKHRQRQFAQLHLLQLADRREAARRTVPVETPAAEGAA
jgi:hypothetical protein